MSEPCERTNLTLPKWAKAFYKAEGKGNLSGGIRNVAMRMMQDKDKGGRPRKQVEPSTQNPCALEAVVSDGQ